MNPKLSIILPVYNEQDNIGPLIEELEVVLLAMNKPFEVIVVDDGSTD